MYKKWEYNLRNRSFKNKHWKENLLNLEDKEKILKQDTLHALPNVYQIWRWSIKRVKVKLKDNKMVEIFPPFARGTERNKPRTLCLRRFFALLCLGES